MRWWASYATHPSFSFEVLQKQFLVTQQPSQQPDCKTQETSWDVSVSEPPPQKSIDSVSKELVKYISLVNESRVPAEIEKYMNATDTYPVAEERGASAGILK